MPGYRGRGFPGTVNVAKVGGLSLAGTAVTSTAAELNLLDADAPEPADAVWASVSRWAKAEYDFAVDGGAIRVIHLGIEIPDNAILLSGMIEVVTTVTGGGGATMSCGVVGASPAFLGDTAFGTFVGGNLVPCAALALAPLKMPAAVNIVTEIKANTITAGKWNVWIEYLMGEA